MPTLCQILGQATGHINVSAELRGGHAGGTQAHGARQTEGKQSAGDQCLQNGEARFSVCHAEIILKACVFPSACNALHPRSLNALRPGKGERIVRIVCGHQSIGAAQQCLFLGGSEV